MSIHIFHTTIVLPDDVEQPVTVTYTYYAGYDGGRYTESPPEPASVEIQSVTPDVPEEYYDALAAEAFEDYAAYCADAAEARAEARAEDRWDER